ncbi:hypothetical protein AB3S75_034178 [Citrus x aurantiifolia]
MGTLCSEKTSREKMAKELVKGKKFAHQLQVLLQKPFEEDGLVSAEDLVVKILRSFTQTLSVVGTTVTTSCDDDHEKYQQQQANSCNVNSDDYRRRSEDSGESKKRPAAKDSVSKRGCYKRKKNSQTWTVVSSTSNDGHAWRKYGQKEILNTKHPRSYFRCTHKYVQGCRAAKQVQRRDDDPQMYDTTYIGHHTCRDIISFPQIVAESSEPNWGSTISTGGSFVVSSSSSIPTEEIKQECKEETTSTDHQDLSSLDSIVWEDFVSFQSSDEPEAAAMVFSCNNNKMISSHSLDMYNDFEHGFHFDDSGIF